MCLRRVRVRAVAELRKAEEIEVMVGLKGQSHILAGSRILNFTIDIEVSGNL